MCMRGQIDWQTPPMIHLTGKQTSQEDEVSGSRFQVSGETLKPET